MFAETELDLLQKIVQQGLLGALGETLLGLEHFLLRLRLLGLEDEAVVREDRQGDQKDGCDAAIDDLSILLEEEFSLGNGLSHILLPDFLLIGFVCHICF